MFLWVCAQPVGSLQGGVSWNLQYFQLSQVCDFQVSHEDLVLQYNIVCFQWSFAGPINELLVSSCNTKHSSYMRSNSQLEILAPHIKLVLAVLPRLGNCYIHAMQSCASLLKNTAKKIQQNSEIWKLRKLSVQVQWLKKSTEKRRKIQTVYFTKRGKHTISRQNRKTCNEWGHVGKSRRNFKYRG